MTAPVYTQPSPAHFWKVVLLLAAAALLVLLSLFAIGVAVQAVREGNRLHAQIRDLSLSHGCGIDACRGGRDPSGIGILFAILIAPLSSFVAFRLGRRARRMVSA